VTLVEVTLASRLLVCAPVSVSKQDQPLPPEEDRGSRDRGGLKLLAALERFQLAATVRGARAVDVGASTGGFTQVLLDAGALSVLCVDAGRGQLRDRLRRDPRVRVREETDWKLLPLGEEPGPFDFFTVDVSFVAARSMLRSLAFRLRPGANGVVLLKPQFELPDRLVRGGDVSDPTLRARAAEALRTKAERLGFRVVAQVDSPVAGGSGTVEMLTHLAFDGRSEAMPRPGERRPRPAATTGKSRAERASPLASAAPLSWFAVTAPGTEEVAAAEVRLVPGAANVTVVHGGVEFQGPVDVGLMANLQLRIPTRLLLRLGQIRAREFGKLRHQLAHLPWEAFLDPGAPLRATIATTRCRLYHTGAIDEALRAAIDDRLGAAPGKAATADDTAPLVLLRGEGDVFTVSIDSSGQRLHRRGWRLESGEAPLRESLAAALLALAGWGPGEALLDPMCGAGTLPIEAASITLGHLPGGGRAFAFEGWPGLPAEARARFARRGQAALDGERTPERMTTPVAAPIVGSDADGAVVEVARRNAERARVADQVVLRAQPLIEVEPPAPRGLLIANPPYGKRLGRAGELPALYRQLGNVLRHRLPGWRAAVILPDPSLASAFRLPIASTHALAHGGLRVTLVQLQPAP
jgi:putative N6-adenine-specific DNA methylase